VNVAALRDAQLDAMADLLAAHVDIDAVLKLVESGAPVRPAITTGLQQ
jgi:adenosylcobyric acid synthase